MSEENESEQVRARKEHSRKLLASLGLTREQVVAMNGATFEKDPVHRETRGGLIMFDREHIHTGDGSSFGKLFRRTTPRR